MPLPARKHLLFDEDRSDRWPLRLGLGFCNLKRGTSGKFAFCDLSVA